MLNITGPGPLWVSRRSERGEPRYDPDPRLYGEFARAVAERYGDRVDRYILWNEPNLGGWLMPQAELQSASAARRSSPHLYRSLVRNAYPEVHAADPDAAGADRRARLARRRAAQRENANHRPLAFLRAFGCVDASFKKLTTGPLPGLPARDRRRFRVPPARRPRPRPRRRSANPDDVALASLSRLTEHARPAPARRIA